MPTQAPARLAAAAVAIAALLLALLALTHALDVPLLTDASPDLGEPGIGAAAASFALLASDVLLPVPSSAVMVANGALFGTVGGAALSMAGAIAGVLLGFALGRRGSGLLHGDARVRAAALLQRRGAVAIVITRPVPVLAETVVILAGAAGMPLRQVAAAAAIGSLAPAVAYALAGSVAERYGGALIVLTGVLVLAGAVWLATARRTQPGSIG